MYIQIEYTKHQKSPNKNKRRTKKSSIMSKAPSSCHTVFTGYTLP